MKSLAMLLIFGGYTLIYAAVANQGEFATEPWAGLFADAYTGAGSTSTGSNLQVVPSDNTQGTPQGITNPLGPLVTRIKSSFGP